MDARDQGLVAGILLSQGSFGGDGKQPQITLRMHTRHEALFRWLMERFPRTKLYGPYHHGERSYFQWMARGQALVEDVLPVLESTITPEVDGYAASRLTEMRAQYAEFIARAERRAALAARARRGGAPVSARLSGARGRTTRLPDDAVPRLEALLALVAEDETAPTTVRDPARGVDAHVADSLSGLEVDALRGAGRDRRPRRRRRLPRARPGRRAAGGSRGARRERSAASARSSNGRSSGCSSPTPRSCARAPRSGATGSAPSTSSPCARSRRSNVLAEYAAPLLVDGGRLVAYKGVRDPAEEADALAAAAQLGLELAEIRPRRPLPGRRSPSPLRLLEGSGDAVAIPSPGGNGPQTATLDSDLRQVEDRSAPNRPSRSDRSRR